MDPRGTGVLCGRTYLKMFFGLLKRKPKPADRRKTREILLSIETLLQHIDKNMPKVNELETLLDPIVTALDDVGTQLEKARQEILGALGSVEIPAGALEKINRLATLSTALKGASQALDDINPDGSGDGGQTP